jgi:hypothetical protein
VKNVLERSWRLSSWPADVYTHDTQIYMPHGVTNIECKCRFQKGNSGRKKANIKPEKRFMGCFMDLFPD